MEICIIKEDDMPLLDRKRVIAEVSFHTATPSKEELKKEMAKKFKTKEELVAVSNVRQGFGAGKAKVIVHVYRDEKTLKLLEKQKKEKKAEAKQ